MSRSSRLTCSSPFLRICAQNELKNTTNQISLSLTQRERSTHLQADGILVVGAESLDEVGFVCELAFGDVGEHCVRLQHLVDILLPVNVVSRWLMQPAKNQPLSRLKANTCGFCSQELGSLTFLCARRQPCFGNRQFQSACPLYVVAPQPRWSGGFDLQG
jgi:hypothetical protein